MKRLVLALLLIATPAFGRGQVTSVMKYQMEHDGGAQVTCSNVSGTVFTGANDRQSVTCRNSGTNVVWFCTTSGLLVGGSPTACTTGTGTVFLNQNDSYTWDVALYGWGLSCITAAASSLVVCDVEAN